MKEFDIEKFETMETEVLDNFEQKTDTNGIVIDSVGPVTETADTMEEDDTKLQPGDKKLVCIEV